MKNLSEILKKIIEHKEDYIFINGNPLDTRMPKYKIYYKWLQRDKLSCFGCGKPPSKFTLLKCKGSGSNYSPNKKKYTLKIFNGNNKPFTLDHWIPKSFLKNLSTIISFEIEDNLVPMCYDCNTEKANSFPKRYKWGITKHKPKFKIRRVF